MFGGNCPGRGNVGESKLFGKCAWDVQGGIVRGKCPGELVRGTSGRRFVSQKSSREKLSGSTGELSAEENFLGVGQIVKGMSGECSGRNCPWNVQENVREKLSVECS